MDMSAAALPAISGRFSETDRAHPLFREWQQSESFAARQMINGQNFADWLYQHNQAATRDDWARHEQYPAFLAWMRANRGGARGPRFPDNFKLWLKGERW